MNIKHLMVGLVAFGSLVLGSVAQADVVVREVKPVQAAAATTAAPAAAAQSSSVSLPSPAADALAARDDEAATSELCFRIKNPTLRRLCLCRKGVDLPNCPPSRS